MSRTSAERTESFLILVVGLVQFINILDFMMVMPLGPDFAKSLGIATHNIGIIGGAYTFAAAITGFIAALFLDRFNRKQALLVSLIGLLIATASGAFAWNLTSLIAARILAGVFGGPLTSLAQAMIADHIPPERRGAAMGKVMGAFAAATVLGVPFGLMLAQHMGWRAPFIGLALMGIIVWFLAAKYLPGHGNVIAIENVKRRLAVILANFRNPLALGVFGYTLLYTMSGFIIFPNLTAHLQLNLDYPRERLDLLYFCGGLVSFFSMRFVGRSVDRFGAVGMGIASTLLFAVSAFGYLIYPESHAPIVLCFVAMMVGATSRNVCGQTLASEVPEPQHRAGFMSLLSTMMHVGSSLGAFWSSEILRENFDGHLLGMDQVGWVSIGLSLLVPVLFYTTERGMERRHKKF